MWIAAAGGIAGVLWLLPSRMREVDGVRDDGLVYRDGLLAPGIPARPGARTAARGAGARRSRPRPGRSRRRDRAPSPPARARAPEVLVRASRLNDSYATKCTMK